MSFAEKLREAAKKIQSRHQFARTEAQTRDYLVKPFLQALGYDPENPSDAEPEYSAGFVSNKKKVDYALLKEGKPVVFVEMKPASISKLSKDNTEQLQFYFATKLDVRFGILTNGLKYYFYADIDNPNIMDDEPFLVADMLDFTQKQAEALLLFTKSSFSIARALPNAEKLKLEGIIRQKVEKEFSNPTIEFVKFFAQRLYQGKFTQSDYAKFKPLVKKAWNELISHEISEHTYNEENPEVIDNSETISIQDVNIEQTDVSFSRGRDRIPVYAHYRGEEVTAEFHVKHSYKKRNDKVILYEGTWYSPSALAKELKSQIHKKQNIQVSVETAGWTYFWYYKDAKTKEGPIDDFRKYPALVDQYLG